MQPQIKTDYHAVPQQGIPFNQQETAYHPQGMYNPPQQQQQQQQQPFYPQTQQPIAPQHTGNTYVQTHSPPPGAYPAPQYPSQPAAPYNPNY
jgi:hypothetical protein